MHELLAQVVEAHRRLARWKRHETLSVTIPFVREGPRAKSRARHLNATVNVRFSSSEGS